jgi:hypothetical protein
MTPETLKRMRGRENALIEDKIINDILESRKMPISYGPELATSTDRLVQKQPFEPNDLKPFQYAFQGQALHDIAQTENVIILRQRYRDHIP